MIIERERERERRGTLTNLHDFENKSRVLEIVFEAEVDLADILRRLRVVDVHVHQGYGTILPKGHLHVGHGGRPNREKEREGTKKKRHTI